MDNAHYIVNFIVYTLAMIGILLIAYTIYKKTVLLNPIKRNSLLSISDMMRLPDRKMLYVIKCGKEEFLIASSTEKVTLISKVKSINEDIEKYLNEKKMEENPKGNFIETIEIKDEKPQNQKVMKSLLKELSDRNKNSKGGY